MSTLLPPQPLFHYCLFAELGDILSSQSLLLSPPDPSQPDTALDEIRNIITAMYLGLSPDSFTTTQFDQFPLYSYSLMPQKDIASLWLKFKPLEVYSFSIDAAQLAAAIDSSELTLLPCLYDDAAKKDFVINTIIGVSPEEYTSSVQQPEPDSPLDPRHPMFPKKLKLINRNILNYEGLLKDISLQDEQEWRIIASYTWLEILGGVDDINPNPLPLQLISVTQNGNQLNCLEAPLVTGLFTTVSISEIVIGPCPDMAQSKLDCENLLATRLSNSHPIITESAVPYKG